MSKTRIFKVSEMTETDILSAAHALDEGAVAIVPTDTVYGIGTGAFCEDSILRIYQIKERPATSPLQILTGSVVQAKAVAEFSAGAERLAQAYWPGAITIILPPTAKGKSLTRGFKGIGLRVPGNPFLVNVLSRMAHPMACTSANLHGQPVLTDEETILKTFDGKADYIFLGGQLSPTASSVVDLTEKTLLLREGGVSRADLEKTLGQPFTVK